MLSGTTPPPPPPPPFSKSIKSNIARNFLQLIDKHFPNTNPQHKIFNQNTVKVSYTGMPNIKSSMSCHNSQILSKHKIPPSLLQQNCNCRKGTDCPLSNNCLYNSIVYKAKVKSSNGKIKEYGIHRNDG